MNSLPMASFMLHLPFCWDISGDWSRDFTWMTLCQFHTNHYQWEEKRLEHIYFLLSRKMNIYLICQCGHLMCIVLINEIWLDWDVTISRIQWTPRSFKSTLSIKNPPEWRRNNMNQKYSQVITILSLTAHTHKEDVRPFYKLLFCSIHSGYSNRTFLLVGSSDNIHPDWLQVPGVASLTS